MISKVLLGVSALSLAAVVTAKPAAKQPQCVNDKVISAMQIRIAQTELMVAGLSCKQFEQWAGTANTKRYNEFVTRYRPTLMDDGHRVLKRFFPTEQRLNDYLTRLANESQLRGNANMAIFCTQATKIYDDLLNGGAVEFAAYSASLPMAHTHGQNACPPAPVVSVVPPVAPSVATAPAAAAPVPESAPQTQTIASVIAANDPPPSGAPPAVAPGAGMQPVVDMSMSPAVKKPPKLILKPEGI